MDTTIIFMNTKYYECLGSIDPSRNTKAARTEAVTPQNKLRLPSQVKTIRQSQATISVPPIYTL
jgi:hypothetical protein